MTVLGIDIGGSGIKGAPVDVETGALLAPRYRLPTPQPSKPRAVAKTVAEIARHFDWQGPIGCGFPAVVRQGVTFTAANVHKRWVGTDAAALLAETTGCPVRVLNDADAAGLAEMAFGAGRDRNGVVLIVTVGTGLGTSLFTDGCLLPNAELGHIMLKGRNTKIYEDAEYYATDAARKRGKLTWKKWAKRLDTYLRRMEALLWPDLIIISGGVSKKHDRFFPYLTLQAETVPALLLNEAGIVGAALAARALAGESTPSEGTEAPGEDMHKEEQQYS